MSISAGDSCGMCQLHHNTFKELEQVTGNKFKKTHTYILHTTH